jgi:hypothetical protein
VTDNTMSQPINAVLNALDWKPVPAPTVLTNLPYVTHEGILSIGNSDLHLFQLSDGQRVINAEDFA